jgi:hypothetical protein
MRMADYVRHVRGMGQDATDGIDLGYGGTTDSSASIPTAPLPLTPTFSPAPTGPTASQDLAGIFNALTQGAKSGVQIYNATQSPSLIPGTNAIFNPATGQYYNPTTGQVVNPFTGATLGTMTGSLLSSPYILMGGLLIGGLLLVSMLGGGRR